MPQIKPKRTDYNFQCKDMEVLDKLLYYWFLWSFSG